MYLGYQNGKIKFYTENELPKELYDLEKSEYTEDEYVLDGEEYVLKDEIHIEKELNKAKEAKKTEAIQKAYNSLNGGEGLYEFTEGKHIEATDGNISKLTSYMLELAQKEAFYDTKEDVMSIVENIINMFNGNIHGVTVKWSTKEDEVVDLNVVQVVKILKGLAKIQSDVWCEKFKAYKIIIECAQTLEDVEKIEITY